MNVFSITSIEGKHEFYPCLEFEFFKVEIVNDYIKKYNLKENAQLLISSTINPNVSVACSRFTLCVVNLNLHFRFTIVRIFDV